MNEPDVTPVTANLSEAKLELLRKFQNNQDLFEVATVVQTLQDLQVSLEDFTLNPEQHLMDLSALITQKSVSPPATATASAVNSLQ